MNFFAGLYIGGYIVFISMLICMIKDGHISKKFRASDLFYGLAYPVVIFIMFVS